MMYKACILLIFAFVAVAMGDGVVPSNDRCIESSLLQPNDPQYGDNTDANFDYNNQGVCGPRSDRQSLWYEVRGNGRKVTVYVCSNNGYVTDFGVFFKCNSQQCVGFPNQFTEPKNCSMGEYVDYTWSASSGEQYYVHVRSDIIDGVGSNFTIWYTEEAPPPGSPTTPPSTMPPSGCSSLSAMVALSGLAILALFV